jgi:hypothetical protein
VALHRVAEAHHSRQPVVGQVHHTASPVEDRAAGLGNQAGTAAGNSGAWERGGAMLDGQHVQGAS